MREFKRLLLVCSLVIIIFGVYAASTVGSIKAEDVMVTTTLDTGAGSLRQLLSEAPAGTVIKFDPLMFPLTGTATILVSSQLPDLQEGVTIDSKSTRVVLDGSNSPEGTNGLNIAGEMNEVYGLEIINFKGKGISVAGDSNQIGGDSTSGEGNIIWGNKSDGIAIFSDSNYVQGNWVGIDSSGNATVGNETGIYLAQGASNNTIGGGILFKNVISANRHNGIWINSPGAMNNTITSNFIGTSVDGSTVIGQRSSGIEITDSPLNVVGGNTAELRNVISGNDFHGIKINGATAISNTVQGNYVGTDMSGLQPIPNGLHGVFITEEAGSTQIGGSRLIDEGNLLSGNLSHGLVIEDSDFNTVQGNIIGPNITGNVGFYFQEAGGIDIDHGSFNRIGVEGADQFANLIGGNLSDGIAIFVDLDDPEAFGEALSNSIESNYIGIGFDETTLLGNRKSPKKDGNDGQGIFIGSGAANTQIKKNYIAFNEGPGIQSDCNGIEFLENRLYKNVEEPIKSNCSDPFTITISAVSTGTVTGITEPMSNVEIYSSDDEESRYFEGTAVADALGNFSFTKAGGFEGLNVTAFSYNFADRGGGFSPISEPVHIQWTFLLYLNGDNGDLEDYMLDTFNNLLANGASPNANVLALLDLNSINGGETRLFDITDGNGDSIEITEIDFPGRLSPTELNLGAGETLEDFVKWGRAQYPVEHVMLSLVNHGGGWAPSTVDFFPGDALRPGRGRFYSGGGSGLSWDLNNGDEKTLDSNFDYLDSPEMRETMSNIFIESGSVDVVYYDVCSMGMVEIAYQIKDYADYFVSSQNIGWAPLGPNNRYVHAINNVPPKATPEDIANLLVTSYAGSIPQEGHPMTVSAVDLSQMDAVANSMNVLGGLIVDSLAEPNGLQVLSDTYRATQKIDYDSDFIIEQDTDGIVDIVDFARNLKQMSDDPQINLAADNLIAILNTAIITNANRSGEIWFDSEKSWELSGTNGLSTYLSFGEDLEFEGVEILDPTTQITRNLRLRDVYNSSELTFLNSAPNWKILLDKYFEQVEVASNATNGPVDGVQGPDVFPPSTTISTTLPADPTGGAVDPRGPLTITLEWNSEDNGPDLDAHTSGFKEVSLWLKQPHGDWASTDISSQESKGEFTYSITDPECGVYEFAILGIDNLENQEDPSNINTVHVRVACLSFMPIVNVNNN